MKLLSEALEQSCGTVAPTRLGLRYVNLIDRLQVGETLGRQVGWEDLVAPQFWAVPGAMSNLQDSTFFAETTSSLPRGQMTLRYGVVPEPSRQRLCFRLDIDRYLDGGVFEMNEVETLLHSFSNDCFQVFMAAAGPSLLEWMNQ